MKLIGIKEFYNITRAKIISAVNCVVVVSLCATATFAVDSALDYTPVVAQPVETVAETSADILTSDETDTSVTEFADMTEASGSSADGTDATEPSTSEGTAESIADATENTSETSASAADATTTTTAATTTEATTEATTVTTTAETTEYITEKELYLAVYAKTTINIRKGPGTEYDVVKSVFAGDQIDVCAVTSNGWYRTYNGNYVKASLTTETKPSNTPTPKPKPTNKPTSSTTAEVTTRATTTEEKKAAPSGEGNTCTITFYGPQPTGNGGYSKSTATGTTCTEGRTCAADWSIYPAGTVIYIENDPLGGDGYYTVEDRGPGVKGYHIDIYAEDGESGNHSTCKRTVIAQ